MDHVLEEVFLRAGELLTVATWVHVEVGVRGCDLRVDVLSHSHVTDLIANAVYECDWRPVNVSKVNKWRDSVACSILLQTLNFLEALLDGDLRPEQLHLDRLSIARTIFAVIFTIVFVVVLS